jgi:anti-anti-sigma factor
VVSLAKHGAITVEERGDVTILTLHGEHDSSLSGELDARIRKEALRGRGVVISVSGTRFIDSAIVQVLFQDDRLMVANRRRLVLHVGADALVGRVLDMSGVSDQLLWSDSLDEAVESAERRNGLPEEHA